MSATGQSIIRIATVQKTPPLFALLLLLLVILALSLSLGRYSVPLHTWYDVIISPDHGGIAGLVLMQVRLPRIAAGILIGAALSVAGASYQGLFRNPMVSPDILGATAGAGFGASAAILFGCNILGVQLAAFVFGLIAVLIVWGLSSMLARKSDPILTLVLVGIIVGALFMALVSMAKYVADPYSKLPAITFWLMGSLAAITPRDAALSAIPMILGMVPLHLLRWRLNVMAFGEEEARALGVNTTRLRAIVIACATLLSASAVAVAGVIGWVGLVIPHLARMIVGPNYKVLLPASLLLGAAYLLLVDDLARSIYATEIPLGIVTALIGAPFFLYLMTRTGRGGWS